MAKKKDLTTELKIKEAARKLFMQKGFAATKTRDIAEEAGLNLALLNYYYRSKEMLFNMIIMESMGEFFSRMALVVNDETTTLEEKFGRMTTEYFDLIKNNPDLPLFIINEGRNPQSDFFSKMKQGVDPRNSFLKKQLVEEIENGKMDATHQMHVMANCIGLILFPFLGAPILKRVIGLEDDEFEKLVGERKELIPVWMTRMFNMK
ncbi:TetR/AcrR family transcriptional regulator [Fulvivirga ligni]|uniref:TetR/AcrR family transcriptional regulator n=1 Tax=Fulvivirga ligni TaxID=2904246 RepID=UPI001F170E33|nr:TetR/AcrR family transcriptional regulator [Fulvivirga ligni]UII21006.1 TetR/AcrR family transcriptional regulator [Fulvivirga ligni]